MDRSKFNITVQTLFAGEVNEQFLNKDIKYKYCFKKIFRGNSQILKLGKTGLWVIDSLIVFFVLITIAYLMNKVSSFIIKNEMRSRYDT